MPINGKKIYGVESDLPRKRCVEPVETAQIVTLCGKKVFMICLICRQTEIVDGFTSIAFEREEIRLFINNVPAQICPNCAEAYVEEKVAIRLLSEAEDVFAQGMMDDVREY
jgi:YgiT-type zinc finger domain-containing protein